MSESTDLFSIPQELLDTIFDYAYAESIKLTISRRWLQIAQRSWKRNQAFKVDVASLDHLVHGTAGFGRIISAICLVVRFQRSDQLHDATTDFGHLLPSLLRYCSHLTKLEVRHTVICRQWRPGESLPSIAQIEQVDWVKALLAHKTLRNFYLHDGTKDHYSMWYGSHYDKVMNFINMMLQTRQLSWTDYSAVGNAVGCTKQLLMDTAHLLKSPCSKVPRWYTLPILCEMYSQMIDEVGRAFFEELCNDSLTAYHVANMKQKLESQGLPYQFRRMTDAEILSEARSETEDVIWYLDSRYIEAL
ncbi:hypothetical protein Slin14017_G109530 [Septoria linicola]|nr:hypothetical protein Slin14017_G109530 [Septoria linicola]